MFCSRVVFVSVSLVIFSYDFVMPTKLELVIFGAHVKYVHMQWWK